jgi:uncharacterized protein
VTIVGVISDTHGLLRPEALEALRGVEHILHAGDVGAPEILTALRTIAPVTAVRGNVDRGDLARALPGTAVLEVEGTRIYVLHDLAQLDLNPVAAGISIVVSGHTHHPAIDHREVLYLNPGSAGPKRFDLPVAVAMIELRGGEPVARIVFLEV